MAKDEAVRCTTFEEVDIVIEFRNKITVEPLYNSEYKQKYYQSIVKCGSVVLTTNDRTWRRGDDDLITPTSNIISFSQWEEKYLNKFTSSRKVKPFDKNVQAQIILFEGQCRLQGMVADNKVKEMKNCSNFCYSYEEFDNLQEEIQRRINELD